MCLCVFVYLSSAEAIAAINGAVITGFERNFAVFAAGSTYRIVHLAVAAVATRVLLAGVAAGLAALGFIVEAFFREKFLIFGSEGELLTAILADDCFVVVH
ncbi:MAG: hypothetical protein ABT01_06475 [Clostridium sp. SCN 57-10]|nr:MAG: hypothetical protein ABT01_06475 [Clostridium sp. SCN 57-10]